MKYFFYTPELMQLATFAPNDGVGSDVIWFGGRPVASDSTDGPDPRFTFTDHLGTPILQTDALANVVWRAEYEPFGNVFATRAGGTNDQRLRFPGQQVAFTNFAGDEESYNIFRWYRSGWGRYTQADPIGRRGGVNLYSYVSGRPLSFADRLGLMGWKCRVGIVLKAGEIGGGGAVTASCTSDCENGKSRFVQLLGLAGGMSVGSPVEASFTDLRVEDDASVALASNLSPGFSIKSLGVSIFWGGSLETDVTLGRAKGKTSGFDWGGLSAGFDALWGVTAVILDTETCCK